MDNLAIYEKVRSVPTNAQREIKGGRLNGKTDINPMWRIKTLTELFGVCGFGWKYEITDKRLERGGKDEVSAFVDIRLYINIDGKWSDGIVGTGGSSFVSNDRNGLYTSDECFKMALTDAISVACKAIGVGADIYWNGDATKYDGKPTANAPPTSPVKKNITPTFGSSQEYEGLNIENQTQPQAPTKPKQVISQGTMDKVAELQIDLRKTARANKCEVDELTEALVLTAIEMKIAYLANETAQA